jgi:hypothetical protein
VTVGVIVGTIAIVLITVIIGLLVDRKYSVVPKASELDPKPARKPAPPTYAEGEAPATAIRASASQLAKLRCQRCATCRSEMTNDADDTVRYNDRELLVLHFSCPAGHGKRSVYVEQTN